MSQINFGVSYGSTITLAELVNFKGLLADVKKAKHYGHTSEERRNILDLNMPLITRFRKHVGDLSFTHWATIHKWAPNGSEPDRVLPMWLPPIFKRPEMMLALYDIVQQSLTIDEFIYDIEQL